MESIESALKSISQRYSKIDKIILFGSRARGDHTEQSDYDIAVFGADDETITQFRDEVEKLPTLHKIDLVFIKKRHIGTKLYDNIMRDGVIIMDKFRDKLENFNRALARLEEGIKDSETAYSLIVRDGVIQRFEFTAELAWKVTREYMLSEGEVDINSPKSVMRAAFRWNIITDEMGWIQLLDDRNMTSHIYDEEQADEIYERICQRHVGLFKDLSEYMNKTDN